MLTAEQARLLHEDPLTIQLDQIERAIKETILMNGTEVYYKTEFLCSKTIEILQSLGYKVYKRIIDEIYVTGETVISWEADNEETI